MNNILFLLLNVPITTSICVISNLTMFYGFILLFYLDRQNCSILILLCFNFVGNIKVFYKNNYSQNFSESNKHTLLYVLQK